MLEIYRSNRLEELGSAFGKLIASRPLTSPFMKETVVVQSRGMQRWLSMQLALRSGIWANGHYPFPNALVQNLFDMLGLERSDSSAYSKEAMSWSIMRILPGLSAEERFSPLRIYLQDDPDGLKLFQLAVKIADTFDQYTLFRPDILALWENGGNDAAHEWQPELWRTLVRGNESSGRHRGSMKDEFCRKLLHGKVSPSLFPERLSLFGISYMPPFHIEMLAALATVTPVYLFLLSPTQEYWGDIVSRRALAAMNGSERELSTEGNPLLASLGRSGLDFCDMVLDSGAIENDRYVEPDPDSLLHALQSDMLNLGGTGEEGVHPLPDPYDRSIQIHSCHSALREVEVLHDRLLDLLDNLPDLSPKDIVVMTPDIETYAPYISTVFGTTGDGVPYLPHTIADRTMLNEGAIASALLKLMDLYGSRFTAPSVFDLISSPPVSRRFGLDDDELDTVRRWVEETRIRWGMDENTRKMLNLPPYRENSWRAGLDRLLLGYAMTDEGMLYEGILPYDVESEAETLGKLADFVDAIEKLSARFDRTQSLESWRELFFWMLDIFVSPDAESERELAKIKEEIDKLSDLAERSLFDGELTAPVMISWLRSRLEQAEMGLGFMSGGITFCAMLPMRSIPFRVVAMIGMNDGAFPRQQRPPGFDLISRNPRKGDRSVRGDDRYLFLESILSARDVLYLSYIGQSIRDNSTIPPSVLVSELLDAIQRGFDFTGDETAESRLLLHHRLQGFNPAYFTKGTGLFSYSAENFRALAGRNSERVSVPFLDELLNEPSEELRSVTIDDLARFYANPSAWFLTNRLGLKPDSAVKPLEEREPFGADGLDAYLLRQELLQAIFDGGDPRALFPVFRSRGMLPPATHGEQVFLALLQEVEEFAGRVRECDSSGGTAEVAVDLELGLFRLSGKLERVSNDNQLFYRCARMKATDRIRSWISHLVLNAALNGAQGETLLVMLDRSVRYHTVDNARVELEKLLGFYWQGLREPLPFFPRSSCAWAEKAGSNEDDRLNAASKAWHDGYGGRDGEGSDPAFYRCFGDEAPFGERFRSIADALLIPMFEHGGKP
ncbi:MAG: exodeoxyribonuclease V subunit gamma [Chlorobiaceae bacterium]|nr:exodeoxyribonuclease V subunit gamma [Chlorobiaceae bacterium]